LQRSLPSLLTTAACSGLRPAPDCRPRRTFLHLSYSYAPPCGPAMLVTQDPNRTSRDPAYSITSSARASSIGGTSSRAPWRSSDQAPHSRSGHPNKYPHQRRTKRHGHENDRHGGVVDKGLTPFSRMSDLTNTCDIAHDASPCYGRLSAESCT